MPRQHEVELQIMLSGTLTNEYGETVRAGQNPLISSGIAPQGNTLESAEPCLIWYISLEPQVLMNSLGKSFEQLPVALLRHPLSHSKPIAPKDVGINFLTKTLTDNKFQLII